MAPESRVVFVDNDPIVLAHARALLVGILQCIPDSGDPAGIVRRLASAVPSGSYVVISHPASDILAEQMGPAARRTNELIATPVTLRSQAQVACLFDGLELLPPGLVQAHRWRADLPDPDRDIPNYGGIARKP